MCVVVDQHGPVPPIRSNAAHLRDHLQDPFLYCGPHIPGSHWKISWLRQRCFPVQPAEMADWFAFLMLSIPSASGANYRHVTSAISS